MHPEDLHPLIEAAAPLVVAAGCLVFFARAVKTALPFSIPWRFIGWSTGIIVAGYALVLAAGTSPEAFVSVLLAVGLIARIVLVRVATAKAREQRAERLRQARGHERRRAPAPLPPGGPGSTP